MSGNNPLIRGLCSGIMVIVLGAGWVQACLAAVDARDLGQGAVNGPAPTSSGSMTEAMVSGSSYGTFYINDCGQPHGGFEYCAIFYATITLNDSIGTLELTFLKGLSDKLKKHSFALELKKYTPDRIEFSMEGDPLILEWVETDTVWNSWHHYYMARFHHNTPEGMDLGVIHPDMFPGIVSWYYVELRLAGIFEYGKLTSQVDTLSAATGGTVHFDLQGGAAAANRGYLLLGSTSVMKPATLLPGAAMRLPVAWDLFTDLVIQNLNSPIFTDFLGSFDRMGQGAAQLNSGPLPPESMGLKLYFTYTCHSPFDLVSEPRMIEIVN